MPNVQIIGRVGVKVIPDTSKFKEEAKTKLESVEKRLPKVKVFATFDSTGLKSEMLKAIRAINAEIKGRDAYKIKFRSAISDIGMKGEVKRAAIELRALAKQEQITFNVGSIAVTQVDLDQTAMKRVQKELEHWRDKISPLKIGVVPEMVNGSGSIVSARLAVLTRPRTVDIIPVIDSRAAAGVLTTLAALSGARVLNDALDGIWKRLKRLDKAVPIIGTLAEAIAGLGGYLLTAGSNLFALSESLAQIGPAALALPGIFAGMAIGLGATIAVVKDFNDIFPDFEGKLHKLQDAMSTKFWAKAEAPMRHFIDTLFPLFSKSIQQTASELGDFFAGFSRSLGDALSPILQSMFDDLNKSIDIAGQHTDAFAKIITVLGQVGAGYLPRLAKWFGDISDSFADFLTRTQADGRLKGWIDQGIFQLKELGRVASGIGSTLAGIATAANNAGGSNLTMMADTLERVAKVVNGPAFQTQLTAVLKSAHNAMSLISEKSGPAFSKFMSTLGKALTTILPMVGNTIGTALDAIFAALSQPEVVKGLADMFSGIQTAVIHLAPAMKPVGKALGALMSIIGALAEVIGPILAVAFTTLANVITTLGPHIESIIGALGGGLLGVLEAIAPSVEKLGPILAATFEKLLPALKPVIDFIVQLAKTVLPILIDGIGQVLVALGPLIEALGKVFAVVGPLLVPVLAFLAELLVSTIVGAITGVVNVVVGLIAVFTGLWNFLDDLFHGRWGQLWGDVQQIFSGVWQAIVGFIQVAWNVGILGMFSKGFKILKALFSGSWKAIVTLLKELWSSLVQRFKTLMDDMLNGTISKLSAIKRFFTGVWGDIKAAASLAWEVLVNIVKKALGTWVNVISTGVSKALKFFRDLPSNIRGIFSGAGSWLIESGKAIIRGLVSGISKMGGAVKDAVSGVLSKARNLLPFSPAKEGPFSGKGWTLYSGQSISMALAAGIASKANEVRKATEDMMRIAHADLGLDRLDPKSAKSFRHQVTAAVDANLDHEAGEKKVLNYYAAPGSSIDSEEDLFAAADRARMVGW